MTTNAAPKLPRVQIIDRQHPHFEEYGRLTGKIITMKFGPREQMADPARREEPTTTDENDSARSDRQSLSNRREDSRSQPEGSQR